MTSFVEDGVLQVGTPGSFQFATMELGARAIMELPPPMPLVLTVGILVRHRTTWGWYMELWLFYLFIILLQVYCFQFLL